MNTEKPFSQEGYALMGAAFEVHKDTDQFRSDREARVEAVCALSVRKVRSIVIRAKPLMDAGLRLETIFVYQH